MNGSLLKSLSRAGIAFGVALLAACSGDSPSAPRQNPPPGGGGQPATAYRITVTSSTSTVAISSDQSAVITVTVRRADNNQAPANGTTVVVSTNLGDLGSRNSGVQSAAVELVNGAAAFSFFGGNAAGTATITAQLQGSVGQTSVRVQSFSVTALEPNFGSPLGGDRITMRGTGFVAPVTVVFDDIAGVDGASAQVVSVTSEQVVFDTPPVPTGFAINEPIDIIVKNQAGTADEKQLVVDGGFTYRGTFFVESVAPNTGSAAGGEQVVIRGRDFESPVRVSFGGVAGTVLSASTSEILVQTPRVDLAGNSELRVDVTVTIRVNEVGEQSDTLEDAFTFAQDPDDIFHLDSLSPSRGPDTGNTLVRIFGGGFTEPVRVTFNGVVATVTGVTQTEIQVRTPRVTLPSGTQLVVSVEVTNALGSSGQATDALPSAYTYTTDAFFIASVTPDEGHPAGGQRVVIDGSGFNPPIRVTFGGLVAQVVSDTSTRIEVTTPPASVPAGSTSTVAVAVTINLGEVGQETDTLAGAFTYTYGDNDEPPVVLGVSPTTGPNEGGTVVRINGANFDSPVQVFFGQGTAANFRGVEATVTSVTPSQLVVVAPPATGFGQDNRDQQVDILVKNLDSGLSTVATQAYRYGTEVIITSIAPGEVSQAVPQNVLIQGQGFDEPVAVDVGGNVNVALGIISVTGTQVIVRTPRVRFDDCADHQGPINLVNIETGAGTTGPALTFRVAELALSNLSPISGPQTGGNAVTINGAGIFEPTVVFANPGPPAATATAALSSVDPNGNAVTVIAPRIPAQNNDPNGGFRVENCDDNGDGTVGTRRVPTSVDVRVSSAFSGCDDELLLSYTYIPDDTTCVGDLAVQDPPVASFTSLVLSGTTVQFTDTSTNTPVAWFWDFTNDGTFDSFDQNPTFTYPGFGTFSVRFRAQNGAGFDEIVQQITIAAPPPPVAGFSFQQVNANTTQAQVQYLDSSSGTITGRAWDFDNNGTNDSTVTNPLATFTSAGTRTTVLTVTGPGGSDSEAQLVQVTLVPDANFTTASAGVGSNTVSFTDTSTNTPTNWLWDFGDNTGSSAQNPTHNYGSPGVRNVSLTAGNSAGQTTETIPINVL